MAIALQQSRTTVRTVSGFDILAGLWLIVAPFALAYAGTSEAFWNSVLAGIAVVALASTVEVGEGYRFATPNWINVAIGAWLIISPFVLGFSTLEAATWNHIITGIVIAALAFWGAMATPREDTIR
jgi:hypothetical protein